MLLTIVNPNSTWSMTEQIGAAARAVAAPGTLVRAVSPESGPPAIESHVDAALAVPGLLAEIVRGEAEGSAGYVVACFGDPGLDAARELATGPVVGIAEAAMHTAMLLGRRFAVVTTLTRTTGRAWELVARYGAERACVAVRACEVGVLELDTDPDARARVTAECAAAVAQDGADVVVLGCAGMADFAAEVSAAIGVPVVDGVAAATVMVEGLVRQGLQGSARGEYAPPPARTATPEG